MAKPIDISKIDRVHTAAMQLIVENGYGGASISAIAGMAGVSEGYLYRHYKGKKELVDYLLNTRIEEIGNSILEYMEGQTKVSFVINMIITNICDMSKENPYQLKFLYVLMNTYKFNINEKMNLFIGKICKKIVELGKEEGFLNSNIGFDHFFTMIIVYPIQYVNLRLKNFFGEEGFSDSDKQTLIDFCINAVK